MSSKRRKWLFRIREMLEAVRAIQDYTDGLRYEQFRQDRFVQDAVAMNLIVIGEAAKHIPAHAKQQHKSIPWNKLAKLRNFIAHEYNRLDLSIVWQVILNELPQVAPQLQDMIDQHVSEES